MEICRILNTQEPSPSYAVSKHRINATEQTQQSDHQRRNIALTICSLHTPDVLIPNQSPIEVDRWSSDTQKPPIKLVQSHTPPFELYPILQRDNLDPYRYCGPLGLSSTEVAEQLSKPRCDMAEAYTARWDTLQRSIALANALDKRWTAAEETLLIRLAEKNTDWNEIALRLPGHSRDACRCHFEENLRHLSPAEKGHWTPREDGLLMSLQLQGRSWSSVSQQLSGRTPRACRKRYEKYLYNKPTPKATWTATEDRMLLSLHGEGKAWNDIAAMFPGRSISACQIHFFDSLRSCWSQKEDDLLVALYNEGLSWREISEQLPGRTVSDCESHFKSHISILPAIKDNRPIAKLPDRKRPKMGVR